MCGHDILCCGHACFAVGFPTAQWSVARFNMHQITCKSVIRIHPCRSLQINFPHYLASVFSTCTHHLLGEKPSKHPLPLPAGKSDVPRHAATTAFSQHTAVDGIRFVQLITLEPATGNPSKVGINRYPIGTMFVYMICTILYLYIYLKNQLKM